MSKSQLFKNLRWMLRSDLPAVLQIENKSYSCPWKKNGFVTHLQQRSVLGMVLEHQDLVVAYMVYQVSKIRIEILNLAVHPDFRLHGHGSVMIQKLQSKLSPDRRIRIIAWIDERNLRSQKFLRHHGFEVTRIERGLFESQSTRGKSDGYQFCYHLGAESNQWRPANRITKQIP